MSFGKGSLSGDDSAPDWQQVQTLRVADVVMTILRARKTMPSATAATVSRTKHGEGYRVLVTLLESSPPADATDTDGTGGAIDGATTTFIARELSKSLAGAFGDKDVFILQ